MTVEIRRARQGDQPKIESFIVAAYGALAPLKGPAHWRWKFAENPYPPLEDGLAPVWIAVDGEDMVGQIAVQGLRLWLNGREYRAGWIVDVAILPAYRGLGLGHLLYAAVARDVPLLVTLTMAPATFRMAQKAGAVVLSKTWQFSLLRRVRADDVRRYLLRRTAHRRGWNRFARLVCATGAQTILAPLANAVTFVRDRRRPADAAADALEVIEIDEFGPQMDSFWRRTRDRFPAMGVRDRSFLHWRFDRCPDLNYRKFLALREGRVAGYSVLRWPEPQELSGGVIVDVVAEAGDASIYGRLTQHAIDHFGRKVAYVDVATSRPEFAAFLRRRGFFTTRAYGATVVAAEENVRKEVKRLSNDWQLSKADHDWDQIRLA